MTDFSVIAIIATIIMVGMVGIGIQITIFLYLIRRIDAMQKEISEVAERVARLEGVLISRLEVGNGTFTHTGDD